MVGEDLELTEEANEEVDIRIVCLRGLVYSQVHLFLCPMKDSSQSLRPFPLSVNWDIPRAVFCCGPVVLMWKKAHS